MSAKARPVLTPTPARLALARAVDNANVEFDPETGRFVRYEQDKVAGVVTAAFNDLRRAGLAVQVNLCYTKLTDAGRQWRAANTKEEP